MLEFLVDTVRDLIKAEATFRQFRPPDPLPVRIYQQQLKLVSLTTVLAEYGPIPTGRHIHIRLARWCRPRPHLARHVIHLQPRARILF